MVIRNKYNAKKITVDGIKFDSKAEAQFYSYLKVLKEIGEVRSFEMQVPFNLQEGFYHPTKTTKIGRYKRVPAIVYKADFVVRFSDGVEKVIDVKGMQTPVFKLKAKMFLHNFGSLYLAKKNAGGWKLEEF